MRAVTRAWPRALATVVLTAVASLTLWPASPADATLRYTATASAAGIRVLAASPSFPLTTTPVDATFPSAQAQVSTLRGNAGFAALPSPGTDAAALPGLVTGLLAGEVPFPVPSVPGVPTIESARCPATPSAGADAKEVVLKATCDDTSANGAASFGVPPASLTDAAPSVSGAYVASTASTSVDPKDGTVTATARTEVTALAFGGGLVTIGPVVSTATVKRSPGGDPQRSTDLALGRISIAGSAVQLGPTGISVLGSPVSLPGVPSPTDAVNTLLKAAGITLTSIGSTQSADGVVGQGLEIDLDQKVPQTGQPVTVKVILGQTAASVSVGGTIDDFSGTAVTGLPSSPATTSTGEPGLTSSPSSSGGVPTGGGPAVTSGGSLPGVTTTPGLGTVAGPAPVVAGQQPATAAAPQLRLASARDARLKGLSFYPILALAALVVIGGATLARHVGVRLLWSS